MIIYLLTQEYIGGFVYEEDTMNATGTLEDAEKWTKDCAEAWIKEYNKDYSWADGANKLVRVEDKTEVGWETKYRRFVYRPIELRVPVSSFANEGTSHEQ